MAGSRHPAVGTRLKIYRLLPSAGRDSTGEKERDQREPAQPIPKQRRPSLAFLGLNAARRALPVAPLRFIAFGLRLPAVRFFRREACAREKALQAEFDRLWALPVRWIARFASSRWRQARA
jgi:hypothetical protein